MANSLLVFIVEKRDGQKNRKTNTPDTVNTHFEYANIRYTPILKIRQSLSFVSIGGSHFSCMWEKWLFTLGCFDAENNLKASAFAEALLLDVMENQYGITVANKYALFLNEDEDPLEILKLQEAIKTTKKSEKSKKNAPDENEIKTTTNKPSDASSGSSQKKSEKIDHFSSPTQSDGMWIVLFGVTFLWYCLKHGLCQHDGYRSIKSRQCSETRNEVLP